MVKEISPHCTPRTHSPPACPICRLCPVLAFQVVVYTLSRMSLFPLPHSFGLFFPYKSYFLIKALIFLFQGSVLYPLFNCIYFISPQHLQYSFSIVFPYVPEERRAVQLSVTLPSYQRNCGLKPRF